MMGVGVEGVKIGGIRVGVSKGPTGGFKALEDDEVDLNELLYGFRGT